MSDQPTEPTVPTAHTMPTMPTPTVPTVPVNRSLLTLDAVNRLWRTVLQALVYAAIAGAATAIHAYLQGRDVSQVSMPEMFNALLQGVGMGALAYLMRRYGDGSWLPTPLPPAPAVAPAKPAPPEHEE